MVFSRLNPIVVMALIDGVILASALGWGAFYSSRPSVRYCFMARRFCSAIAEVSRPSRASP
jgi:hypothetical protein